MNLHPASCLKNCPMKITVTETETTLQKMVCNNSLVSMVCRSYILLLKGIFPYLFPWTKEIYTETCHTAVTTKPPSGDSNLQPSEHYYYAL